MSMWKILNNLFGWDYIVWENSCDGGVARIRVSADGNPYFWQYGKYAIPLFNPKKGYLQITCWLTCSPEKYIPKLQKDIPHD